jgi:hypothetical protein
MFIGVESLNIPVFPTLLFMDSRRDAAFSFILDSETQNLALLGGVLLQQFPFYHTQNFVGYTYRDFVSHKAYSMQKIRIAKIKDLIF